MQTQTGKTTTSRRHLPRTKTGRMLLGAAIVAVLAGATIAVFATAGSPAGTGTVKGLVVYGPLIPVDPGSPIGWVPQSAVVTATRVGSTAVVVGKSGPDGRFAITLTAGRYVFRARSSGAGAGRVSHPVSLTVSASHTTRVRMWLDNGVRFPPDPGVKPAKRPSGHPLRYEQWFLGFTARGPVTPVSTPGHANQERSAARLLVYRYDGSLAATVTSTPASGFVAALPVGEYIVEPLSSGSSLLLRAAPFSLHVSRGAWVSVTVVFDTGIR